MVWDNDKSTAADPDNPNADEQLTADEWDNHVSEGHWPSDELNFGVDGNGDPVITDPQNGGQTVMRYDRSAGSWVVDALEANDATHNNSYTDPGGIQHSERLADVGELFVNSYESTISGGGSVSNVIGEIELREPGNASNKSETRIYSPLIRYDPSQNRRVRLNLSGVTVDNDSEAKIQLHVNSNPDASGATAADEAFTGLVQGKGKIEAITQNGGNFASSTDTSQDNTYVNSLNYLELSWDGSALTFEVSDGSTTITLSESRQYAGGASLYLSVKVRDNNDSKAVNSDINISGLEVAQ